MSVPASRYLFPAVCQAIRQAVAEADGNEVFFLGHRTEGDLRVQRVEALARGQRQAVLAVSGRASFGDVVIHNHPSGQLVPSNADMAIASGLADEGVGFFIVDNGAERVYAVVEPFAPEEQPTPLDPAELARLFAADGPLAEVLAGYEPRGEQTRLAQAVAAAFAGNELALLEAGTGTGKSLAYLLPAALWALQNRERVLVATGTINLQEQLIGKDLVVLRQVLARVRPDAELRVVLIKGRGNYLCLRRLELARREQTVLFPDEQLQQIEAIAKWAEVTREGARQDLSFEPHGEVWDEVCSEGDSCGGLACPRHGACFYMASRRQASRAHLMVANHHLFCADAALRVSRGSFRGQAVLPEYRRAVFDEAHKLEDAASSFFGGQVSRQGLKATLGRLYRRRSEVSSGLGLLVAAGTELLERLPHRGREVLEELLPEVAASGAAVEEAFEHIVEWVRNLAVEPGGRGGAAGGGGRGDEGASFSVRLTPQVLAGYGWDEVVAQGTELAGKLRHLGEQLAAVSATLEDLLIEREDSALDGLRIELRGSSRRLGETAENLEQFLAMKPDPDAADNLVRWVESRQRRSTAVHLRVAPLDIGELLGQQVLGRLPAAVLTSATLSTGPGDAGFNYLRQRLGLRELPEPRLRQAVYPSPFDYSTQALVGIVLDLPEPNAPGFAEGCAATVLDAVTLTAGRAFVLFTSYSLLQQVHGRLAPTLRQRGLTPLCQGEVNRTLLLEQFRSGKGSVLFGTDSFWEGVDVRGEALQNVVIVRLPFRVPSEPLLEARVEAVSARGGDPFRELTLPQAIIRFRQGFGRLIRSRTDRGVVLILDRRAHSRPYGRAFVASLPTGLPVVAGPSDEVLDAVRDFFGAGGAPG